MDFLLKQFADVETASTPLLSNISNIDTEIDNYNESNEE